MSRIRNLDVSRRLIALVLVLALGWAACEALSISGLLSAKSSAVRASDASNALLDERNAYEGWLTDDDQSNMAAALTALPRTPSNVRLEQVTAQQVTAGYKQAVQSFAALDKQAAALHLPASFVDRVRTAETDLAAYNKFTVQVLQATSAWNVRAAAQIMTVSNVQISNQTQADFDALNTTIVKTVASIRDGVTGTVDQALLILVVLTVIGVAGAYAVSRWVLHSIKRPLARIGATLDRVEAGDLTARTGLESADEFGRLARRLDAAVSAQADAQAGLERRGHDEAEAAQLTRAAAAVTAAVQGHDTMEDAVRAVLAAAQREFGFVDARYRAGPGAATVECTSSGWLLPIAIDGTTGGVIDCRTSEPPAASDRLAETFDGVAVSVSAGLERIQTRERERQAEEALRHKVDRILEAVNAAAEGDLTSQVAVSGTDPIGQVGEGLARFIADLRERVTAIGGNSRGLASAADGLMAIAAPMSEGAGRTANEANVVTETSQGMSQSVQVAATAAEELTESIREIAKSAAEAARVAVEGAEAASVANDTVTQLRNSTVEIGEVISAIGQIAGQTNLLALNASIEASRAGDAGKGFAVVADEVKQLAEETAVATESVANRIQAIQGDSVAAFDAIERINQIIGRINDHQATIASAVEEQTATTNEIARSISDAAVGASTITGSISDVAEEARRTSEGADETRRSADEMARLSSDLHTLIGRFRT